MRVSTKMTLGISAVSLLFGGFHGWRQLRQERQDLRNAVEREVRVLGNAIQVSFEHALRDRQFTDIQGALDSLEGIAPDLDLFVFGPQGDLRAQSAGSTEERGFQVTARQVMLSKKGTLDIDAEDRWRVTLGLPLFDGVGTSAGAIVMVRPLAETRRDLHDTRRDILISLAVLVGAITCLQALIGSFWVTGPLTKMAAGMRELRQGKPAATFHFRRHDEVGRLAGEFDALVEELRQANERIAREIEARVAIELGLQRVDKLATIGQLSAGLAHEIGSPLQIMSGRARSLMTRDLGPEEVRKNAAILAEQADRIAGIVEQLLSFARRRPVRLVEADLGAPVSAVLDLLAPAARRRRIELQYTCRPDLPKVIADVDQIQQVVLNLLNNALAATPDGGHISIRLDLSSLPSPGGALPAARLQVEDDGCGMTEETRRQLFEPFFTTRAAEGGTGLGLAVVRAIVQAHGGAVDVVSSLGEGSRFTIDLPLRGAHA